MPLAKNMTGAFPPAQARALGGTQNLSVTAAGTTQATAVAMVADMNRITAGTGGARLYAGDTGDSQLVYNATASAVTIYPPTGAAINQLATNSGFLLGPNTSALCFCFSSTIWTAYLSA